MLVFNFLYIRTDCPIYLKENLKTNIISFGYGKLKIIYFYLYFQFFSYLCLCTIIFKIKLMNSLLFIYRKLKLFSSEFELQIDEYFSKAAPLELIHYRTFTGSSTKKSSLCNWGDKSVSP